MPSEESFSEGFGALQACRRSAGSEAFQVCGLETVHDPGHQRLFGADDRQRDLFGLGEIEQPIQIGGVDRHIARLGFG